MHEVLKQISKIGIVPVIKIENPAKAIPLAKALCDGGLPIAEVTFRTACAKEAIAVIAKEVPQMLVGAGTVLTTQQVDEAVEAGADIIMFDNMTHDDMAAAIELIAGRAKTECSGNVDASNIRALADLGVDYISSGALTHSAPILDLSLKHLRLLDGK